MATTLRDRTWKEVIAVKKPVKGGPKSGGKPGKGGYGK